MHGLTLSSVENVSTLRQHGFGNVVKAHYWSVSRGPLYILQRST